MITNRWFNGIEGSSDAFLVRRKVFVEEQGFLEQSEFDAYDAQSMHLVIYDGENPIAAGRLYHDGKTFRLGRLAVIKEYRGQGVGDMLIKVLLLKAFGFSPSKVCLSAQIHAKDFYERYGFFVDGEEIEEEGVRHVPMSVTKETLVFKSKCGHDKTFWDFFEQTPPSRI